jgi:arylsulfatase
VFGHRSVYTRGIERLGERRPQIAANRSKYIYYPATQMAPSNAAPQLTLRATRAVRARA